MTRSRGRYLVLGLVCSVVLGACSLAFGQSERAPADQAQGDGALPRPDAGIAPVVRIVDPPSGAVIPANQRVNLTVMTDTTATRFQLVVGGKNVSIVPLPPDQSGPTTAILSWTPTQQGTYSLEVTAYNGAVAGPPAALLLTVSGTASSSPAGAVTGCTARVLVPELNFRAGPGVDQGRLGQFSTGEVLTVLGRSADLSWYKVRRATAQEGWVINNAQWIQLEGDCSALSVVG